MNALMRICSWAPFAAGVSDAARCGTVSAVRGMGDCLPGAAARRFRVHHVAVRGEAVNRNDGEPNGEECTGHPP